MASKNEHENPAKDDWDKKVFQHPRIHSASYSPSRRTLRVEFGPARKQYEYRVPPDVWENLKRQEHPHSFLRNVIESYFPGRKPE